MYIIITMQEDKNQNINKTKKINKTSIKNMGVDIDKNEFREIVLSNSNNPEKNYYKRDYYD